MNENVIKLPEVKRTSWQDTVRQTLDIKKPLGVAYLGEGTVYAAASKSDPRDWHYVFVFTYDGERLKACSCRSFRFRDSCHHTEEVP